MAKFRKIYTSFWDDGYIETLTPESRYFYLYLLTNPETSQCGIYSISKRKIAFHTGYNIESIESLLNQLVDKGRILYNEETKELCIIHWGKYNLKRGGAPIIDCLKSELSLVKDKSFIQVMKKGLPEDVNKDVAKLFEEGADLTQSRKGEKPARDRERDRARVGERACPQEKEEEKEEEKEKEEEVKKNTLVEEEKPVDHKIILLNQLRAKALSLELKKGNDSIKLSDWLYGRFPSCHGYLKTWTQEWFTYFIEARLKENKDPLDQHPVVYKNSLEKFVEGKATEIYKKQRKPVY